MIELDKIYNEDCLEGMKRIADGAVDCIITDLPYGTTDCLWDSVIPLDKLWEQFKRVTKPNAAIVLFGSEPFSTMLRMSNLKEWRYDWIWKKPQGVGFLNAKKMPLKIYEIVSVFYRSLPTYNPQFTKGKPMKMTCTGDVNCYGKKDYVHVYESDGRRYPVNIVEFNGVNNHPPVKGASTVSHPTQKPVDLLRYLILTYSNEGDTILDATIGSGTTAVAALMEKRHFIGFETNKEYFNIAQGRIDEVRRNPTLF